MHLVSLLTSGTRDDREFDGQPYALGVAATRPPVLRGVGIPVADFDGSGHRRLVVNASALTTRPASNIRLVDLRMLSFSRNDPAPTCGRAALYQRGAEQNAEGSLVPRQSELPLKLHRRHALV